MTDVTDRAEVERILEDPAYRVPEADAAATRPAERFRAHASRFVNGAVHADRRRRLEALLVGIDVDALAIETASRARSMMPAEPGELAAQVPVACLAARLGFDEPDATPGPVAALAADYPTGGASEVADAAAAQLLGSAPPSDDHADGDHGDDTVLRVQLLVQAHAATSGLITSALRLPAADDPGVTSADLLAAVLRDAPPVRQTRRVAPDGDTVVLHLDGPDGDTPGGLPRTLAFGAGPRACPAQRHALAIATAVVDEVRAC